jgi:hypothetical protein
VTTTTAGTGYTGTVSWSGSPGTFAPGTTYTATITLTPTSGYTLTGVTANLFTVAGATSVANSANAGVITAVFPATAYILGDTGPGYGKIFYVAATPFACGPTLAASCTYLEAAPNTWYDGVSDLERVWGEWYKYDFGSSWGCNGTLVPNSHNELTLIAIGTGYKNSLDMIEGVFNLWLNGGLFHYSAVAAVRAYAGGLKNDWFLPSQDELNQLYLNRETVGGFANGLYWSSTEYEEDCEGAYTQNFSNGNIIPYEDYPWYSIAPGGQVDFWKERPAYVRPVRAF